MLFFESSGCSVWVTFECFSFLNLEVLLCVPVLYYCCRKLKLSNIFPFLWTFCYYILLHMLDAFPPHIARDSFILLLVIPIILSSSFSFPYFSINPVVVTAPGCRMPLSPCSSTLPTAIEVGRGEQRCVGGEEHR